MRYFIYTFLLTILLASCSHKEIQNPEYLEIVQDFADTMLEFGRDHYGAEQSPLFATTLDRETKAIPEGPRREALYNLKREEWGIREHDRMMTGANPMHDLNFYQILYSLSKVTGESCYAQEADATLKWFFENCQSDVTGLMAWGEHIGWDFYSEKLIDKKAGTNHEFYRSWELWPEIYRLSPENALTFAQGLWDHQIGDHTTGKFSRHAKYDRHAPGFDSEYPRHGGFYIHTWAHAYKYSQDEKYLKYIKTLIAYFESRRQKSTGMIPAESAERSKGTMVWVPVNLSLAICLGNSIPFMPDSHAYVMKESAAKIDELFLALPHEPGPNGKGFIATVQAPFDSPGEAKFVGWTKVWQTGYGSTTNAGVANRCIVRFNQTQNENFLPVIRSAAEAYLTTEPDIDFPVYPGTMGQVILLLVDSYRLFGDEIYLERAHHFANRAVEMFFENNNALPKASTKHDHYEAVTMADTMLMSFLKLFSIVNNVDINDCLIYSDL